MRHQPRRPDITTAESFFIDSSGTVADGQVRRVSYWSPARTDVMRWVLKPSQCIRPT
jgi:hypothetical protein